jgi:hypothetical protein
MVTTEHLLKKLAEDLSRERIISLQVRTYIADQYGYDEDQLVRFFDEKVPTLEDYEVDLTFSPLFTPSLEDRAAYAAILGEQALSKAEVHHLSTQLAERNLYGHFITPKRENIPMILREVTIDRFVDRLYLEHPIDADVFKAIEATAPKGEDTFMKVLGRDSVWQEPWRRDTLIAFLAVFHQCKNFSPEKL